MSAEAAAEPEVGYRQTAVSGAVSTGVGTVLKGLLQVLAIVVLARLLVPDDFGLLGMIFPIIAFATIFQEAGLGVAVIQRGAISDDELGTMFWLNAAISLFLCLLLFALSPLVASFYREPRVTELTAATGVLILLGGLSTQHLSLLNRSLKYRELAWIDTISIAVGTVIAIAVAWFTRSYWAIFLLTFATAAAKCLLAWMFSGWLPRRRAPLRQVADLLRFGGHMTASNLGTYLGSNLDNVLIGRVWGAIQLGFYERAYKIVTMPIVLIYTPLFRLLTPLLSRTREQPERYRRMFLTGYQASLFLTVPGLALLVGATDVVVSLVLGPKWTEGSLIFTCLGAAALCLSLTGPLTIIYVSQGRAKEALRASIATSIYSSTAFAIGVSWGALGVAAAFAISAMFRVPVTLWYATRKGPVAYRDTLRAALPFILAACACTLVLRLLSQAFDALTAPLLYTAAGGILAYLITVACLLITRSGRDFLSEAWGIAWEYAASLIGRLRGGSPAQSNS